MLASVDPSLPEFGLQGHELSTQDYLPGISYGVSYSVPGFDMAFQPDMRPLNSRCRSSHRQRPLATSKSS